MSQDAKWTLIVVIGVGLYALWSFVTAMVPLLPSPWPPFYWALPVHGQVVDAETGSPMSGVIVVAHWELETEGWSPRVTGQAAVMEDVTDDTGHFTFRWWCPRWRWFWEGHLEESAPELLFFKSGYTWTGCHTHRVSPNYNPFPGSDCDEATIKLKKFEGNEREYSKSVEDLDTKIEFAFKYGGCFWKKTPYMLVALDSEGTRLTRVHGYRTIHSLETRADRANERWCGSLTKYMRRYAR